MIDLSMKGSTWWRAKYLVRECLAISLGGVTSTASSINSSPRHISISNAPTISKLHRVTGHERVYTSCSKRNPRPFYSPAWNGSLGTGSGCGAVWMIAADFRAEMFCFGYYRGRRLLGSFARVLHTRGGFHLPWAAPPIVRICTFGDPRRSRYASPLDFA